MDDLEELARIAVDCGFKLHQALGPGLLESVYEACLFADLAKRGLNVERQKAVPIRYNGLIIEEGFRIDLLVEGRLIIEPKSTEAHAPVHGQAAADLSAAPGFAAWLAHEFWIGDIQGRLPPPGQQSPRGAMISIASRLCVFARVQSPW